MIERPLIIYIENFQRIITGQILLYLVIVKVNLTVSYWVDDDQMNAPDQICSMWMAMLMLMLFRFFVLVANHIEWRFYAQSQTRDRKM